MIHCFIFNLTQKILTHYDKTMNTPTLGRKPKNIRSRNIQIITDLYREKETLSVSEIAKIIKLSRTTVMKINEELLEKKVIIEAGKGDSTEEGGKRPAIFRFNSRRNFLFSFHIKYNSIDFCICDLKYRTVYSNSEPMKLNDPFSEIAVKMKRILERQNLIDPASEKILACLVGIHGNVNPESGICIQSTHFPSWGTFTNLREILQNELSLKCPIHIDSWTRYKVFGESKLGTAKGHDTVVLIDAGWHGISSGILMNGEIYLGKHYLSGEIGHIRVNRDDHEICACGSRGCLEQQISLDRLKQNMQMRAPDFPGSSLKERAPEDIGIGTILKSADKNDPLGMALSGDAARWLALSISQVIMFFDPDMILIEGDYACGSRFFEQKLIENIKEIALPRLAERNTEIFFKSEDSISTLTGAAAFGIDKYIQLE